MITARRTDRDVDETFLKLVNFKWLMAGEGWRVSLNRLQSESGYINECLRRALASESELLRKLANELSRLVP